MKPKVEKLRIVFEDKITSFLHKDRRRLNVHYSFSNFPFRPTHIFKLSYYPTGASCADRPKRLPGSVIDKIENMFCDKNITPDLRIEYGYCKITNKPYTVTTLHLNDKNLNEFYDSLEDYR